MAPLDQLAPDETLSPELVLVLPPELRAAALARLAPPLRPERHRPIGVATPRAHDSLARSVATVLFPRMAQLMVIFVAITALTFILAAVANAVR